MTLLLKPAGRGNWKGVKMVLSGGLAAPYAVRVGETFMLGGIRWRVCEVAA